MPLYEYQCTKCGGVLEVLQRLSDAPLTVHPDCGGQLEKLVSTSAFQFKGTGWYVTDYARGSKSGSPAPKPEGKDAKNGAPKPAAESKESKPAPAPAKT
jgi:putative FmdB family regulatory protein